jgi:CIC family chloride channel protein
MENKEKIKALTDFLLISIYAAIVGIVAGLGAVLFRYLIGFFHNLFLFGKLSFSYDSNMHFTSPFGVWVILIVTLGMFIMGYIIERYAPETKGHGVPEVIDAVLTNGGKIRQVVALVKIIATAIGIGAGESAGREGPIVQIGASFGSTLGQILNLNSRDTILLLAAGSAGGIAATFNAPIAGVLFAVELILPEFSPKNFIPLIISSTVATSIARIFLGAEPTFIVSSYKIVSPFEYSLYFLLGIIAGGIAILFIASLASMEKTFDKIKLPKYTGPVIGGLSVGILGYLLLKSTGHYYIFGVGYSFITDVLTGRHIMLIVVVILIFAKIFATSISLGSGGSGGILAPSLFVGAATGSAFGIIAHHFFPALTAPPAAYALVGMAAVTAGTTGATLTTIVLAYELTHEYSVILPLMLGAVTSSFVVTFLYGYTMYTEPLWRKRKIVFHGRRYLDLLSMIFVKDAMISDGIGAVYEDESAGTAKKMLKQHKIAKLIVLNKNKEPIGLIRGVDIEDDNKLVRDYYMPMDNKVSLYNTLLYAMYKMRDTKTDVLAVVDQNGKIVGVLPARLLRETYLNRRGDLI